MEQYSVKFKLKRGGKLVISLKVNNRWVGEVWLCDLNEPGGYISRLRVEPKFQNKGYGTRLLYMAIQKFQNMGCEAVSLHCLVTNVDALRFYRRSGFFIAVSTENDDKDKHYFMAKQLQKEFVYYDMYSIIVL